MDEQVYEALIDEVRQPQYKGEMMDAEATVSGTNASCGDAVMIFLKFEKPWDTTSPISEISWIGEGCVISQASMSALAAKITAEKLTLSGIQKIDNKSMEESLRINDISVGRIKCMMLGVKTLGSSL